MALIRATSGSGGSGGVVIESIASFSVSSTANNPVTITTTKKAKGVVMWYVSNGSIYELMAFDGSNSNHPFWSYNTYYDNVTVTYNSNSIVISNNPGTVTWSGYILY